MYRITRLETTAGGNFEPGKYAVSEAAGAIPNKERSEVLYQQERSAREGETGAPTKEQVEFETTPTLARKFNQAKKRADFNNLLEEFLQFVENREAATKPATVETASRHMPALIERHVQARTNGLCAYPGCQKPGTSFHHTQRWALENIHDPARLHLLCTAHERLAHASLIENEEKSPEHWHIRTDLNAQGFPELPNPLMPLSPKGYIDNLVADYRRSG